MWDPTYLCIPHVLCKYIHRNRVADIKLKYHYFSNHLHTCTYFVCGFTEKPTNFFSFNLISCYLIPSCLWPRANQRGVVSSSKQTISPVSLSLSIYVNTWSRLSLGLPVSTNQKLIIVGVSIWVRSCKLACWCFRKGNPKSWLHQQFSTNCGNNFLFTCGSRSTRARFSVASNFMVPLIFFSWRVSKGQKCKSNNINFLKYITPSEGLPAGILGSVLVIMAWRHDYVHATSTA